VIDPIYSKPQVAINFKPSLNKLGDISFDVSTKLVKNGVLISKSDIQEMDVVYSVTDINGNNRSIFIYNDKAEGDIKGLSPNGSIPTSIQIDTKTYSLSKDMDLATISQFKIGDKVAAVLGYDGKVVALKKITYKTTNEVEVKILGNGKTSDDLLDNQVLTNSGKYYVLNGAGNLEVGGKYIVSADGNTIVGVKKSQNVLENYGIKNVIYNTITYIVGEEQKTLELPKVPAFYYHGREIDYQTAVDKLQVASSVVLSQNNGYYEYGIIVDPIFSNPVIKNYENGERIKEINDRGALFIYRDGAYLPSVYFAETGDVIYEVSDIWRTQNYIYVLNSKLQIASAANILPNKINPESMKIDNVTYNFSKYFDASKLRNIDDSSIVTVVFDRENKIIDISLYSN
jgi:hypothetical protein